MKKLFVSLLLGLFSVSIWATTKPLGPVKAIPKVVDNKPVQPNKKLKVVTTLSVLESLAREVGGNLVEVASLSSATDDPHFVKAKPTFKRLVSEADVFILMSLSFEQWAQLVLSAAGNQKLTGVGLVIASLGIKALEVPGELTRTHGDIHPQGNPHMWLSPLAALKMAENIKNAFVAKEPANKAIYEKNFLTFKTKLAEALFGTELVKAVGAVDFLFRLHEGKKLTDYLKSRKKALGGWVSLATKIDYPFITYHSVWSYLADEFGLNVFGFIEEKSGVPPSLKYQNELVKKAKASHVTHIVAASYYVGNNKLIELITSQIAGKKMYVDVDCRPGESYIDMMNRILKSLVDFK